MRVALVICVVLIGATALLAIRVFDPPGCSDVTIGQAMTLATCRKDIPTPP